MLKKYTMPLSAFFILFIFSSAVQAEVDLHEGLWKMTVKTEMSGMPMPVAIPETSYTQCITKKDLIPKDKSEEGEKSCKIVDQKISGNTITWRMECTAGETQTKASGSITYSGDSMNGTTDFTSVEPGMGEIKMKQSMHGKRIGSCKK